MTWPRAVLLACLTLLQSTWTVTSEAAPLVRLRVATINPADPPQARDRQMLGMGADATPNPNHPSWGHLRTREQVLVTFSPNATHEERLETVEELQTLGAIISGIVPDDSMVLLVTPAARDAAHASPHILWMVCNVLLVVFCTRGVGCNGICWTACTHAIRGGGGLHCSTYMSFPPTSSPHRTPLLQNIKLLPS